MIEGIYQWTLSSSIIDDDSIGLINVSMYLIEEFCNVYNENSENPENLEGSISYDQCDILISLIQKSLYLSNQLHSQKLGNEDDLIET